MDALAWFGLVGLALVDSTSMGTLVLPLVLLVAPRVDVGRYLVYLATVTGFYAVVGIGLVAASGPLLDLARDVGDARPLRWAELVVGGGLAAIGILGDPRRWFGRKPPEGGSPPRAGVWRARLQGPDATYGAVAGVGLLAALIEVASMLPFLAAIGIITAASLPAVGWVPLVLGYCLVMVLPALLLLVARQAFDHRLRGPLDRFAGWLDRHSGNSVLWVCAIVGLLLVRDGAAVLFG